MLVFRTTLMQCRSLGLPPRRQGLRTKQALLSEIPEPEDGDNPSAIGFTAPGRIIDREDEYKQRRLARVLSPERNDAFKLGDKTPDVRTRTYADVMKEAMLARERDNTLRNIAEKQRAEAEQAAAGGSGAAGPADAGAAAVAAAKAALSAAAPAVGEKRRNRWDAPAEDGLKRQRPSEWDSTEPTPQVASRWDATPGVAPGGASAGAGWDATPGRPDGSAAEKPATGRRNRWDATPAVADGGATPAWGAAASASAALPTKKSRWDETPAVLPGGGGGALGATPAMSLGGATPAFFGGGATPAMTPGGGLAGLETPLPPGVPMTPEAYHQLKWERELDARNRFLSDEELDALLPGPAEGYKVLDPPPGYQPIRTPARKLAATPSVLGGATPLYSMPEEQLGLKESVPAAPEGLPDMKPEDMQFFGKLLQVSEQ